MYGTSSGHRSRKEEVVMMLFKSCPRCQGDMHVNRDMYGEYRECLQCGLMQDIEARDGILASVLARSKKKAA